jgi:hypothetical protein
MSNVGYYRVKVVPSAEGITTVKLYTNGSLASTATVIAKQYCSNFRILKYIDGSGRFRFFPFNDRWEQKDKVKSKGEVTKFVTSILNSQTDSEQVGYSCDRTITLTAGNVSDDELEKLSGIYTSPLVYLYVGTGSNDRLQDWVQVKVSGDGISRRRKAKFGKVSIDVTLPEIYAITKN